MPKTGIKGARLSPQQMRLWSLQEANHPFRSQCAVAVEGKLVAAVLLQALYYITDRYEILHTTYSSIAGADLPVQVINQRNQPFCFMVDMQDLSVQDQELQYAEHFTRLQCAHLDLTHDAPLRAVLLRNTSQLHMLFISLPALNADAFTLKHLSDELFSTYHALLQGTVLAADDEPLQYVDVSAWLSNVLESEEAREYRTFWDQFDVVSLMKTPLPLFHRAIEYSAATTQFRPAWLDVPVDSALSAQLQAVAQRCDVSCQALLLACWQILLWRLTGTSPYPVGVACDGRHYEELMTSLGLYTCSVPLNTPLYTHFSFAQFASLVDHDLQEALKLQTYFSWDMLLRDHPQVRPFFPVSFEFTDWPSSSVNGLRCSASHYAGYVEPFVLRLRTILLKERLHLELHYDASTFSYARAQQITELFYTLLRNVPSQSQLKIDALSLLSHDQHQRYVQSCIGPQVSTSFQSLPQRFELAAEQFPHYLAVICGAEQLTYSLLNLRANQLARALYQRGVRPGVLVGLCIERSVSMLVGMLAILKAGGAYVPLDPAYPPTRLVSLLTELANPLLLTQEHVLARLTLWDGPVLCLDRDETAFIHEPGSNLGIHVAPQTLAYIMYTSGSTGAPKGVVIQHQGVSHYTQRLCQLLEVEPGWHFATVSTLSADLGNTAIFASLASGGCLHILPYDVVTSAEAFARYTLAHPLDVLKIVPSHLSALLSNQDRTILPTKYLIVGGEAFPQTLLTRLQELRASCRIINHYGPTETTIGAVVNVLYDAETDDHQSGWHDVSETVPLGQPLPNMEAYILDSQQMPVPSGVVGELYLGGAGLAAGYWQQPQQTGEKFVPHPFSLQAGARLYRTGDRVYLTEEGQLLFVGRNDLQVKLRGYRVELGEIEAALRQHTNVRDCVVLLSQHGASEAQLQAYVVPRQIPPPVKEELRTFLEHILPVYMLPSAFTFLRSLPLTLNGKVDRQALLHIEATDSRQTLVLINQEEAARSYLQPRDEVEFALLCIWEELLNIHPISILDSFFALGGHSILAVRLMSRIHKQFGQDLALMTLFQAPTIAELAVLLRTPVSLTTSSNSLVNLQPGESVRTPFFCVHPAGSDVFCYTNLARHLGKEQPFYALQPLALPANGDVFTTVEVMAEHYLSAIRTVQPHGPYLLGGWSLGGIIAFEMARQLEDGGENVALLAIIDSDAPDPQQEQRKTFARPDISDTGLAQSLFNILDMSSYEEAHASRTPLELLEYALSQAKLLNKIPADADVAQLRRIMTLEQRNLYAVRSYTPRISSLKITLLRAADASARYAEVSAPATLARGWELLTIANVEVHSIPGKHSEMVEEPHVREVATILKRYIDDLL